MKEKITVTYIYLVVIFKSYILTILKSNTYNYFEVILFERIALHIELKSKNQLKKEIEEYKGLQIYEASYKK